MALGIQGAEKCELSLKWLEALLRAICHKF
jgi:hypothetical protein